MTGEDIFGLIIMLAVCSGCGILCFCLGICAQRSQKPIGFWTGKEVKPESITDIAAYNWENYKMWKLYSVPYFSAFAFSVAGIWIPMLKYLSIVLLCGVCTVGIGWLIWQYERILRKYSVK